jgi:phospholipase/carboxylesterase
VEPSKAALQGLLLARPSPPTAQPPASGKVPLALGGARDGFLFVPARAEGPYPLIVFFHGAGGEAAQAAPLLPFAEERGVLLLSIDSRGSTWDLITGQLGADVGFLERALRFTFARFSVDASRLAAAGFSDGASYALSLGLANGELFSHVLAFSPGFSIPPALSGQPRVFVSHGTVDNVLPIASCSRDIVPRLQHHGYVVRYREFDGGHGMPQAILADAFQWML